MKTIEQNAHSPLPWKFLEGDPKDFSGMDAWGNTFAVITDQEDEVKQEYVGFTLNGEDAALIVKACNLHQDLLDALVEINRDAWSEDKGTLRSIARKTDELLARARQ